MKSKKVVLLSATALLAVLVTAGTAYAVGARHTSDQRRAAVTADDANESAFDTSTEAKYVSVAPCRVVDTRKGGGPLKSQVTRDVNVGGTTGFTAQGGASTGCGIPAGADSAQLTITMLSASANGYLHAWGKGASEPAASFLNFAKSFNVSASAPAQLGTGGALSLKVFGATSGVVIDVTGYYIKPLFAYVDSATTVNALSSRLVSVSQDALGTGTYDLLFDRDVSRCSYQATAYTSTNVLTVEPLTTDLDGVFVAVHDNTGALSTAAFYITVTC